MKKLQEQVYQSVVQRGYRAGHTPTAFVVRQLVKSVEEAGEAMEHVAPMRSQEHPPGWQLLLHGAALLARRAFDSDEGWDRYQINDPVALAGEMADIIIPLLCAAQELEVDLGAVIEAKARLDIGRGVRQLAEEAA